MKKDIKVFSTPTCPYCIMVKDYLKKNGFDFMDIDLTQKQEWIPRVVEKSGQMGVPQIWIDDEVVVGFNVPALSSILNI